MPLPLPLVQAELQGRGPAMLLGNRSGQPHAPIMAAVPSLHTRGRQWWRWMAGSGRMSWGQRGITLLFSHPPPGKPRSPCSGCCTTFQIRTSRSIKTRGRCDGCLFRERRIKAAGASQDPPQPVREQTGQDRPCIFQAR